MASPSKFPLLPLEIIIEILLKLPPKPLLKFKCVSKSWLKLISTSEFVKTHIKLSTNNKEFNHHRVLYPDGAKNFKVCSLSSLFYNELTTSNEVFGMNSPTTIDSLTLGSVNGLIYLLNMKGEALLWNPTIGKSKKLSSFGFDLTRDNLKSCGFGYDELHDDYKVVFVEYFDNEVTGSIDSMVMIHSLKTDSWRTVDKFEGGLLINVHGEFVNGKLYWASSDYDVDLKISDVVSFDLTDETWRKLEFPCYAKRNPHLMMGVVGSDFSVLSASCEGVSFDVWIMKDCGVDVSWKKMFSIKYPPDVPERMVMSPLLSFSIHFSGTNEGEILLMLPSVIMIYNSKDGSIRELEVTGFDKCCTAKIYVESLVDPLLIADQEIHNRETSPSI